jgi:hypothetical protein
LGIEEFDTFGSRHFCYSVTSLHVPVDSFNGPAGHFAHPGRIYKTAVCRKHHYRFTVNQMLARHLVEKAASS